MTNPYNIYKANKERFKRLHWRAFPSGGFYLVIEKVEVQDKEGLSASDWVKVRKNMLNTGECDPNLIEEMSKIKPLKQQVLLLLKKTLKT